MSPKLKDGTYHISIVVDNKEKYLDLSESNPTPGTPIIGFTPDNDKTNQKVSIFPPSDLTDVQSGYMKFQWVLVVKKSGTMGSITSLVKESASCATTGSKQVSVSNISCIHFGR